MRKVFLYPFSEDWHIFLIKFFKCAIIKSISYALHQRIVEKQVMLNSQSVSKKLVCTKQMAYICPAMQTAGRAVTGNTCPRGAEYAKSEATAPVRTVTSTVCALGGVRPVVAVKTVPDVPKGKIFAVMDAVRALEVSAPVHIGDILCENIADTGSNLVAAADLDAE